MNSTILQTATRYLLPLLIVFSLVVLLQGHNRPGGGFIGGLIVAAAFSLHAMAFDPLATRRAIRADLPTVMGLGLLLALLSGLAAVAAGESFLTALWFTLPVPGIGPLKVGTTVLFDIGVYLVVFGVVMSMALALLEE